MLNFFVITLGHTDLYEGPVSEQNLIDELKTFKRTDLLKTLSKVGFVLYNESWNNFEVQPFLAKAFFDPDTLRHIGQVAHKVQKDPPKENPPIIFSEFQIVNLVKLAILHTSDESGVNISTDEDRFRLGKCCLIMNSLLFQEVPEVNDGNREEVRSRLKEEIIRNSLFQENDRFGHAFVRAHELFQNIPRQMKNHSEFYDIPAAFEKATGFSVDEYLGIGFSLWSWWSTVNMTNVGETQQIVIDPTIFFRDVTDRRKCEGIFDQLSLQADLYKATLVEERTGVSDSWQFRYSNVTLEKYPLIQSGGRLICLSMKFLTRKLTTNLFYTINNSLSHQEALRFRTFFGRVFEEYARQVLKRCLKDRCRSDHYGASQAEACEAVLVYPRVLVIVEAKSSRLSLATVQLGDIDSYRERLKKVVLAGCTQIDRVIRDFKDGKYKVEGAKPREIGRFYPLIVTIHSFPQEVLTRLEIDSLIAQSNCLKDSNIAPVTLISIGELEYLEALLNTLTMVDILGDKTGNPEWHSMTMKNFLHLTHKTLPDNEVIHSEFLSIGQRSRSLLFPNS